MTDEPEIIYGIFKQEIKNRFLCSVEIDGEEVVCYVPSSCRLSNFLNMTDRQVMLVPIMDKKARTRFALYALKYGRGYIPINLSNSNRVIEQQIHRRYFSFLGKRSEVLREQKIDDYKCDLFVKDTNTVIEVKSLLSFEQEALFPTVYSERAVKQLQQISGLLDEGYKVCFILVSLSRTVKKMRINPEIMDFYELFQKCVSKGMIYQGFSLQLKDKMLEIKSSVPMEI